jgi:hypothetical protein
MPAGVLVKIGPLVDQVENATRADPAELDQGEAEDRDECWEAEQRDQARERHNLRDSQAAGQVQQRAV